MLAGSRCIDSSPYLVWWSYPVRSTCDILIVNVLVYCRCSNARVEMGASAKSTDDVTLRSELRKRIEAQMAFQRKWRSISMAAYVFSTIGTLLCTACASILAALEMTVIASILAAMSTVLVGTEKSLLFREKWKFHLSMYTKFEVLNSNLALGIVDEQTATEKFSSILMLYATDLPISRTEGDSRGGA